MVIFRRGATVAGHPSLVFPPMSPFVSVLGGCLLLAPACVVLCLYAWLYDGCCFIYKAGRKPVSWIPVVWCGGHNTKHRWMANETELTVCLSIIFR